MAWQKAYDFATQFQTLEGNAVLQRLLNKVNGLARPFGPSARYHRSLAGRPRSDFARGSIEWLVLTENHFGGFHTNVRVGKISSCDPRNVDGVRKGAMTGGDRMSAAHHGYASKYAQHLARFLKRDPTSLTIVEAGILKGTGLAIWAELFPGSNLVGLDIDLGHYERNTSSLRARGGFKHGAPHVFEFDQLKVDMTVLPPILAGRKIDIMMDDGYHSKESIINTLLMAQPHLASEFAYFIEDNCEVATQIQARFSQFAVDACGELTVLTQRQL